MPQAAGKGGPGSGWRGSLRLVYRQETLQEERDAARAGLPAGTARTVVLDRHDGPLRVLASLYPEGDAICHNVLVHPPGGMVGGDELQVDAVLAPGAHALITTAGATRFYRSTGAPAWQAVQARVEPGARLEWLPLETIAFSGCIAENRLCFDLAPGAEMIGWDLLALGMPASALAFERGRFTQRIELPGRWLERGVVDAADRRLLDSPIGWAGHRVMATLWFAAGVGLPDARRDTLLDTARALASAHALNRSAGATAPDDSVIVLRVLAPRVEPAMQLLSRVWAGWRLAAWGLPACVPRVWRT